MNQESYLLMSIILTFLFLKGINVDYLYKLVEYFQNIHNYYDQWFNTLHNIHQIQNIVETVDDTKQEIPYEQKYLKEIANMSKEYVLDESESELKKIKFIEYYNIIINKYVFHIYHHYYIIQVSVYKLIHIVFFPSMGHLDG
jgi:hypothetical protein